MADTIALTVPITTPSISGYTPGSLFISLQPSPTIVVTLVNTIGVLEVFQYPSPPGTAMDTAVKVQTMIDNLNVANLPARNLWKRVMDRLLLDFPSRFVGGATVG